MSDNRKHCHRSIFNRNIMCDFLARLCNEETLFNWDINISTDCFSAVIFDVDGTFYYLLPVKILLLIEMVGHLILHPSFIKEARIINAFRYLRKHECWKKRSLQKQVQFVAEKSGLGYDDCYNLIKHWLFDKPAEFIPLFKNEEVLRAFSMYKKKGVKTVVYSDYPPEKKLSALNIFPDYVFYHGDGIITEMKPSSRSMEQIKNRIGSFSSSLLYFGDSDKNDGMSACLAGANYINIHHIQKMLNVH